MSTIWQENAELAATTDRDHAASLVVAVARTKASALIRDGKPGRAHYELERAVMSAARILGAA